MSILKDTKSVPAIILKNVDFPQIVADALPVKLPELPVLKKPEKPETPAVVKKNTLVTRVMESEITPIAAAAAAGFLTGVIVGLLISPVKNGIQILSNNDLHTEECGWCDEDEEEDED